MDLAELGLAVDDNGAVRTLTSFAGAASQAGRSAQYLESNTRTLSIAMRGLGGYLGVRALIEYADTWRLIQGRIQEVTTSHEQAAAVQQRLVDIAEKTRTSFTETANVYTRLAINARDLGVSHAQLLTVTEAVNNSMLITGTTGVRVAQSLLQFSQAFAKGRLDAQEFHTAMRALPVVADAIADHLHVTTAELFNLASKGKLSIHEVMDAIAAESDKISARAREMPMTIGQAFTIMSTQIMQHIGVLAEVTGATSDISHAFLELGDHITTIVGIVAGLTAAYITLKAAALGYALAQTIITAVGTIGAFLSLATAVTSLADAWALLGAALSAEGVGALLAILAGIAGYVYTTKKMADAQKEWNAAVAAGQKSLNDSLGDRRDTLSNQELKQMEKARDTSADIVRIAHQKVALAGLEGDAEKELAIHFDAVNERIKAGREYQDDNLKLMLNAIDVQEELHIKALNVATAIKAQAEATKAQTEAAKQFNHEFERDFSSTIDKVLHNGLKSFTDFFVAIRDAFYKLISDMAASAFMKKFGNNLASAMFAGFGTGVSNKSEISLAQAAAVTAAAEAAKHQAPGGITGNPSIDIPGIVVTAHRSFLAAHAKELGAAGLGLGVGSFIGNQTTNTALGGLGGALGGASAGFAVAGPVGAAIGGLTGAIGGMISAHKKHIEELRRNSAALAANNETLQKLRDTVLGSQAGSRILQQSSAVSRALAISNAGQLSPKDLIDPSKTSADFVLIRQAAQELGITLSVDGKFIGGSLEQLNEALKLTQQALTQFGNNVDDQQKKLAAYNKLFFVRDTPKQELADSYSLLKTLAPDLLKKVGLENIDLTTQAGRAALTKGLQAIYQLIVSGQLTPDLLGAFTDKNQLIDAILNTKDALDKFAGQLSQVTTDFPRAMDVLLFEQQYGHYGVTTPTPTSATSTSSLQVNGDINITTDSSEDGEAVLRKVERAARARVTRGGTVNLDTNRF